MVRNYEVLVVRDRCGEVEWAPVDWTASLLDVDVYFSDLKKVSKHEALSFIKQFGLAYAEYAKVGKPAELRYFPMVLVDPVDGTHTFIFKQDNNGDTCRVEVK